MVYVCGMMLSVKEPCKSALLPPHSYLGDLFLTAHTNKTKRTSFSGITFMYQLCAGQRRATNHWADWIHTKEKMIEPNSSQCNGKCEWALEGDRPKFKGLPTHSGYRNMAGVSILMCPQLWNGVPLLPPQS